MAKYTEDFGTTYHTVIINAENFTDAYVKVDVTLSKDGAIIDLFEII